MKPLILIVSLLALQSGPSLAQTYTLPADVQPKDTPAKSTQTIDEALPVQIITEEAFAASYINYLAPPETMAAKQTFSAQSLRFASTTELAVLLAQLTDQTSNCTRAREQVEQRIGTRPGSYSVNTGWVRAYQNCLLQRKKELVLFEQALTKRYLSLIEGGGEEGATQLTGLVDRLSQKHSALKLQVRREIRLQKKFVAYYNSGQKDY